MEGRLTEEILNQSIQQNEVREALKDLLRRVQELEETVTDIDTHNNLKIAEIRTDLNSILSQAETNVQDLQRVKSKTMLLKEKILKKKWGNHEKIEIVALVSSILFLLTAIITLISILGSYFLKKRNDVIIYTDGMERRGKHNVR